MTIMISANQPLRYNFSKPAMKTTEPLTFQGEVKSKEELKAIFDRNSQKMAELCEKLDYGKEILFISEGRSGFWAEDLLNPEKKADRILRDYVSPEFKDLIGDNLASLKVSVESLEPLKSEDAYGNRNWFASIVFKDKKGNYYISDMNKHIHKNGHNPKPQDYYGEMPVRIEKGDLIEFWDFNDYFHEKPAISAFRFLLDTPEETGLNPLGLNQKCEIKQNVAKHIETNNTPLKDVDSVAKHQLAKILSDGKTNLYPEDRAALMASNAQFYQPTDGPYKAPRLREIFQSIHQDMDQKITQGTINLNTLTPELLTPYLETKEDDLGYSEKKALQEMFQASVLNDYGEALRYKRDKFIELIPKQQIQLAEMSPKHREAVKAFVGKEYQGNKAAMTAIIGLVEDSRAHSEAIDETTRKFIDNKYIWDSLSTYESELDTLTQKIIKKGTTSIKDSVKPEYIAELSRAILEGKLLPSKIPSNQRLSVLNMAKQTYIPNKAEVNTIAQVDKDTSSTRFLNVNTKANDALTLMKFLGLLEKQFNSTCISSEDSDSCKLTDYDSFYDGIFKDLLESEHLLSNVDPYSMKGFLTYAHNRVAMNEAERLASKQVPELPVNTAEIKADGLFYQKISDFLEDFTKEISRNRAFHKNVEQELKEARVDFNEDAYLAELAENPTYIANLPQKQAIPLYHFAQNKAIKLETELKLTPKYVDQQDALDKKIESLTSSQRQIELAKELLGRYVDAIKEEEKSNKKAFWSGLFGR